MESGLDFYEKTSLKEEENLTLFTQAVRESHPWPLIQEEDHPIQLKPAGSKITPVMSAPATAMLDAPAAPSMMQQQ